MTTPTGADQVPSNLDDGETNPDSSANRRRRLQQLVRRNKSDELREEEGTPSNVNSSGDEGDIESPGARHTSPINYHPKYGLLLSLLYLSICIFKVNYLT